MVSSFFASAGFDLLAERSGFFFSLSCLFLLHLLRFAWRTIPQFCLGGLFLIFGGEGYLLHSYAYFGIGNWNVIVTVVVMSGLHGFFGLVATIPLLASSENCLYEANCPYHNRRILLLGHSIALTYTRVQ